MQAAATASDFSDLPDDNADFMVDPNPHKTIAQEAAKVTLYKRACQKCGGSGRYNAPSSLGHNVCTLCKGRGYFETKVSPEQRQARQARKEVRSEKQANARREQIVEKLRAWQAEHPAETQWLRDKQASFEFAAKMVQACKDWGSLTENQLAAVRKCMASDAARAAQNSDRDSRKQAVDITPVIKAFEKAGAQLKAPKLYTEHFHFSKAPSTGKNPGAIYVKTRNTDDGEGQYLGKIFSGLFTPSRDCTPELQANLMEVCQDPLGAVVRYGRLTGRCGICARKLETKESVERGIGPICAEKFGF